MKRHVLPLLCTTLLIVSVACKKHETETTSTTDTSSTYASSSTDTTATTATDTSATSTTDTSMTSTSGTSTAGSTSALDKDDREFLVKAGEGGIAEVNLGQLASTKAASADVKAFGNQMVSDHSKANDELKALAQQKSLTLAGTAGKEGEETSNKLSAKNGKDFDKAYMDDMVKDHEKDVKEFEKASKDAKDPDIKAWAAKTLPTLQHHLQMAKETQKKVK